MHLGQDKSLTRAAPPGATCCFSLFLPPPPQTPWNGEPFNSWLPWISTGISQDMTALMRSILCLITAKLEPWELWLQLLSTCMAAQQSHRNPGDQGCPTAHFELWLCQKPWDMSCAGCRTRGTASGMGKWALSCKLCFWFVRGRHLAKNGWLWKTCCPVLGWKEL